MKYFPSLFPTTTASATRDTGREASSASWRQRLDNKLPAKIWRGGTHDGVELTSTESIGFGGNRRESGKRSTNTVITMTQEVELSEMQIEDRELDEDREGDEIGSESGVLGNRVRIS